MTTYFAVGPYRAKIIAACLIEASTGTDQVLLSLELQATLVNGQEYAPPQSRFPPEVYLPLSNNCLGTPQQPGWVTTILQYLGFDGNWNNVAQLAGWEGDVYNTHETRQDTGELRDKWSISQISGPRQTQPPNPQKVRQLMAQTKGLFTQPQAAPPKPAPRPAPQTQLANGRERQVVTPQDVGRLPDNASRGEDIPF